MTCAKRLCRLAQFFCNSCSCTWQRNLINLRHFSPTAFLIKHSEKRRQETRRFFRRNACVCGRFNGFLLFSSSRTRLIHCSGGSVYDKPIGNPFLLNSHLMYRLCLSGVKLICSLYPSTSNRAARYFISRATELKGIAKHIAAVY